MMTDTTTFPPPLSTKEREHAEKFIEYQNMRGGRVALTGIQAPNVSGWCGWWG